MYFSRKFELATSSRLFRNLNLKKLVFYSGSENVLWILLNTIACQTFEYYLWIIPSKYILLNIYSQYKQPLLYYLGGDGIKWTIFAFTKQRICTITINIRTCQELPVAEYLMVSAFTVNIYCGRSRSSSEFLEQKRTRTNLSSVLHT